MLPLGLPLILAVSCLPQESAFRPMISPHYGDIAKVEAAALATIHGRGIRRGGKLIFQTGAGPLVLRDKPVEGEGALHHRCVSTFLDGAYALVLLHGWEWWSYRLVHLPSGHTLNLDGVPILSPDGTLAVVHSLDLDAGYANNSMAVIRFTESGARKVFFYNFGAKAGPSDPEWKDGHTITFRWNKLVPGDNSRRFPVTHTPGRLRFLNGKWVLS